MTTSCAPSLTNQQIDHAFDLLLAGTRLEHIAKLLGYGRNTLRRQLEKDQRYKDRPFKRVAAVPITSQQIDHAFELFTTGTKISQIAELFDCEKRNLARLLEQDPRYKNYPFRRGFRPSSNCDSSINYVCLDKLIADSEIALSTAYALMSRAEDQVAGDRVNAKMYCVLALHNKYPEHSIISIGRVLRIIRPHSCYYDAKLFRKKPQFKIVVMDAINNAIGFKKATSCNWSSPVVERYNNISTLKRNPKYTLREDGKALVIKIPVPKAYGVDIISVSLPYVSVLREDYPFA